MASVQILLKKSYLATIRNAAQGETRMFRNLYATVDGKERDILRDGQVSCAAFVSAILYLQNSPLEFMKRPRWISFTHATVPSTEKDMAANGWMLIDDVREGAVVTWEPRVYSDGQEHLHIGFAVGDGMAVSNASNADGIPREHPLIGADGRKVQRIWWHPVLDEEGELG